MRIWYQSYVDYGNGAQYWDLLKAHLAQIVDPGTRIEVHGITPHDSYTHPIVVKAAETAVKLRRLTGLGVNRTSDYVKPPPHVIEEFLAHPKGL